MFQVQRHIPQQTSKQEIRTFSTQTKQDHGCNVTLFHDGGSEGSEIPTYQILYVGCVPCWLSPRSPASPPASASPAGARVEVLLSCCLSYSRDFCIVSRLLSFVAVCALRRSSNGIGTWRNRPLALTFPLAQYTDICAALVAVTRRAHLSGPTCLPPDTRRAGQTG